MNKSFYHYLLRHRQPVGKDEITLFANHVYEDHGFPKHSADYHEISSYLELNGEYLPSLTLFDRVWELYIESESV
ncbi:MAG TPA: YozE family protein [Bacillaceae bacterium]